MFWKILGWVLICSAIGNIFGLGNIPVGILAIFLAFLCFRKAGNKKTSEAKKATTPSIKVHQNTPPVTQDFRPSVQSNTYAPVEPVSRQTLVESISRNALSDSSSRRHSGSDKVSVEQKFTEILSGRFPEYSVRRNVDFASMTSEWWVCSCGAENIGSFCCECGKTKPVSTEWICQCGCSNISKFCSDCGKPKPAALQYKPIDFLLMRDGIPKLAILLADRRHWNTKPIRNTIEACEQAGIPWQRYFKEYDNDVSYVSDRIRSDLR